MFKTVIEKNLSNNCMTLPTHKKYVNCRAKIAIPSLSYEPATDREM